MKSVIFNLNVYGATASMIKSFNKDNFIMDLKIDTCRVTIVNCLIHGTNIYLACLVDTDPNIDLLKEKVMRNMESYLSDQYNLMLTTHSKEYCNKTLENVKLLTNENCEIEEIPVTRELFRWIFLS